MRRSTTVSSRFKAVTVLATVAMLFAAGCSSSKKNTAAAPSTPAAAASTPATAPSASAPAPAPSSAPVTATSSSAPAPAGKIKVTLLTKSTGGFWDAMIAGAKKFAADNPDEVDLTTNACKTNDDTPCQIAEIQDAVTKGTKAIVISPMGVGVTDALLAAQAAGVKIVFVDNTIPGVIPDAVSATDK